jgi:sugar diacid utilization regulator
VVLRAAEASPEELAAAARGQFDSSRVALTTGVDDVRMCVAFESVDRFEWTSRLIDWQARLSEEFGPVSIGHALRMGAQASDVRYALVQASEAVLTGDRLFGAGHVTSYADAVLAGFLLGRRDTYELRALFEQAVGKLAGEDLKRDRELVRTLDVYCETVSTQRTAERLGVHRNTVLYRLRQIEEISSFDLEDGPTRLLLRLGLLAGRLVRQGGAQAPLGFAARSTLAALSRRAG